MNALKIARRSMLAAALGLISFAAAGCAGTANASARDCCLTPNSACCADKAKCQKCCTENKDCCKDAAACAKCCGEAVKK